ncbi:hypothetical protein LZ554_004000 [Drepanopeziza brunnea f. sp. 'monogermtubi']|nr:hypothetical protein LZ554_004000 [Drepanopeziza brunnea f. sp. 'monogermtubi']
MRSSRSATQSGSGGRKRSAQEMSPPQSPATKRRAEAKVADLVELITDQNIPVYTDPDSEYFRSIAVANRLFRFAQPALVVHPRTTADVEYIIRQAKRANIPVTIKNGGHAYSGSSVAYKGRVLIDMHLMSAVKLDMASKTISIEGGALWGHCYKPFVVGEHIDGYTINGGRCPGVGVAGFLMGGGLGPFTRSFGMGCDSLLQATLVTANSGTVTVKATDDPNSAKGKLFWALCGGGGGNFGVVVELKMKVEELKNPTLVNTRFTWYPEDLETMVTTMKRFYKHKWSNEMTIDSTWLCDHRPRVTNLPGHMAVRFIANFNGTGAEFDRQIRRAIKEPSLLELFDERKIQEKSSQFLYESLDDQWREEGRQVKPANPSWSIYTSFVFGNDAATINQVTAIIKAELASFKHKYKGQEVLAQIAFIHTGGEASRRSSAATAFPWRDSVYQAYIMVSWDEPEAKWMEHAMRSFLRRFKAQLQPHSHFGGRAAFVNFPDNTIAREHHENAYYGPNAARLRAVKALWDADNFFDWPQAVRLPTLDVLEEEE